MATYLYTDLPAFAVLPFDPYTDSIDFSGSDITSWAQITIPSDSGPGEIPFLTDTRFIFLMLDDPLRFVEANFINMADGGRFLIGDNSNTLRDDDLSNTLIGGTGADFIGGLGGNDSVSAGGGNDFIVMFNGNDGSNVGADQIDGGSGFDVIVMPDNDNNGWAQTSNANLATGSFDITAVTGFDSMGNPSSYSTQTSSIVGGSVEALIGADGNDTFTGSGADNYLYGGGGADTIAGGAGNDSLFGGFGNDTLAGGLGNDLIRGSFGVDSMAGGDGDDSFWYFSSGDLIDGGAGIDTAFNRHSASLQNAAGVENLTLVGNVGPNSSQTTLEVFFTGNYHGDNNPAWDLIPELIGNSLANVITGNDQINFFLGGPGNDTFVGNGGFDFVTYDGPDTSPQAALLPTGPLTVGFTGGGNATITGAGAGTDSLTGIEGVGGSEFNDSIDGGTANDDQFLAGGSGNDTLLGGGGNDTLTGNQGNDSIAGGDGSRDMATYFTAETGIVANLSSQSVSNDGNDSDYGTPGIQTGSDSLAGIEDLAGGVFADSIIGSSGDNRLWGGAGNDTITPGTGNDSVDGGDGIFDNLVYSTVTQNMVVNLATGTITIGAEVDAVTGIEQVRAGSGNDSMLGGNPAHQPSIYYWSSPSEGFEGGAGNDTIDGGGANDGYFDSARYANDIAGVSVNLGTGTATDGWGNTDTLLNIDGVVGSAFADSLAGGSSSTNLDGNLFEVFNGGGGNDTIDGGAGNDRADFNSPLTAGGVNVNLATGVALDAIDQDTATGGLQQGTDSLSGIEGVRGAFGSDTLVGNGGNNFFEGLQGSDSIDGGSGNDIARYDSSPNGIFVNLSLDTATDGFDSDNNSSNGIQPYTDTLLNIEGASGTDFSDFFIGQAGQNNFFDGRGGARQGTQPFPNSDTVDYSQGGHTNAVTVNLATQTANDGLGGTDTLRNIEAVFGTVNGDSITGSDTSVEYTGLVTDRGERFRGNGGDDTIDGGNSAWGNQDTADYTSSASHVSVDLAAGQAYSDGFGGTDVLINVDGVNGGFGDDVLFGGSDSRAFSGTLSESFRGGAGNDTIDGRDGFDTADYASSPGPVSVDLGFGFGNGFNFNFGAGIASDGQGGTDLLWNIEQVRGGQFNDTLVGGGNGYGDREVFQGNAGDDFIDGRDRYDLASYASSPTAVYVDLGRAFALDGWGDIDALANVEGAQGSDFDDTLIGGLGSSTDAETQVFEGRAGNDLIDGADGFDNGVPGSIDNDLDAAEYRSAPGAVNVNLITGIALDGYGTTDTLIGIEIAVGSRFNDTIIGGNTSDANMRFEGYNGRAGDDSMVGGAGNDWLSYEEDYAGVTVNLSSGTAADGWGGTDTFTSMEHAFGSDYGDLLIGSSADNFLLGNDGADTLRGGAGNDSLHGGGDDKRSQDIADYSTTANAVSVNLATGHALAGADGNDILIDIEGVRGSAFADTLIGNKRGSLLEGGAGNDTIHGAGGLDLAVYSASPNAVVVNLATGIALDGHGDTDALIGIEGVLGSINNDTLIGSSGDNLFYGDLGNDSIVAGGGIDTLTYQGASGSVTIDLVANTVSGAAGDDVLSGTFGIVEGSSYAEVITGATLNDFTGQRQYLHSGGGADTITGGGSSDMGLSILSFSDDFNSSTVLNFAGFIGGSGAVMQQDGSILTFADIDGVVGGRFNDTLIGEGGNDYFEGGFGADWIDGGGGTDLASYRDSINPVIVNLGAPPVFVTYVTARGDTWGTQTISGGQSFESDQKENDFFSSSWMDSLSNIENVEGGAWNDTLFGAANADNLIDGGAGNDSLSGGGGTGNDTLIGGSGFDTVTYAGAVSPGVAIQVNLQAGTAIKGASTDTLIGIENVIGTSFADTLTGRIQVYTGRASDNNVGSYTGLGGNDTINGGSAANGQFDNANYFSSQNAVAVNLGLGTASDGIDNDPGTSGVQAGVDQLSNIDEARGSAFDDTLLGGSSSARISGTLFESFVGNAGNDSIDGLGGEDRVDYRSATAAVVVSLGTGIAIDGQGGTDRLKNIEFVRGSAFSDLLTGGSAQNFGTIYDYETFEGLEGNDTIDGLAGADIASYFLSTGAVTVDLAGGFANDGFGTRDTLLNIEQVIGSDFGDSITGSGSLAVTEAFLGGAGNDTIDGGAGNDLASYNASPNAVHVSLVTGIAQDGYGDTDSLISIEAVRGSIGNDTLLGGAGNESFEGLQGNDSIDGGAGNDRVDYQGAFAAVNVNLGANTASDGSGGTDTLLNIEAVRGSGFNDTLTGRTGNDTLSGGAGNDTITPLAGNDIIDGGDGIFDAIVYSTVTQDMVVNFATGTITIGAEIDTVAGIEQARGGSGNDSMAGGNPTHQPSILFWSSPFELFEGGAGNDTLQGGSSTNGFVDVASYSNDIAGVTVNLATGSATDGWGNTDALLNIDGVTGSAFNDTLIGGSNSANFDGVLFEHFLGGAGNDSIDGAGGLDRVDYHIGTPNVVVNLATGIATGGGGNDTLAGIEGVRGSAGTDTLTGNAGSNFFEGMQGNDSIDGGGGNDIVRHDRSTSGATVNLSSGATDTASDGFGGTDTLAGIEGASGSDYSDFFVGQAGQNNFFDGRGGTWFDGQPFAHRDTVDYSQGGHTGAINVNLATGLVNDGLGGTDTLTNIEFVIGTNLADLFVGSDTSVEYAGRFTDRAESFRGGDGNDSFDGGSSSWGDFDSLDYSIHPSAITVDLASGTASGGGGNDVFANIDAILAGAGNDSLYGGSGSRSFDGSTLEVFRGGGGNDFIDGRGGDDVADYVNSASGVSVDLGSHTASDGFGGTDQLWNIEAVRGGQFSDTLVGSGSSGRESFEGNSGGDSINGGGGLDIATYLRSPNGVYVDLGLGYALDGWGALDTLVNIEGARGSDHDDTLIGGAAPGLDYDSRQVFDGRGGNDLIDGGDGLDAAEYLSTPGAANINLVTGVAQDGYGTTDTLTGIEIAVGSRFNDTITGGNASTLSMQFEGYSGRAGNDSMVGGAGNDWLIYSDALAGVSVNLATGTAADGWGGTDSFTGMEHVIGSDFGDSISGSASLLATESFQGGAGNDTLDGAAGNDRAIYDLSPNAVTVNLATGVAQDGYGGTDTLLNLEAVLGSSFDDTLLGGASNDTLDGGAGNDLADYSSSPGAVLVNLATGVAQDGYGGTDSLISIESVRGTAFADTLIGGAGNETLAGGAGNDSLAGGAGTRDLATYVGAVTGIVANLGSTR